MDELLTPEEIFKIFDSQENWGEDREYNYKGCSYSTIDVYPLLRAQIQKLLDRNGEVREKVWELLQHENDGMCVRGGYVYDGDGCPKGDENEGAYDCETCYSDAINALYLPLILAAEQRGREEQQKVDRKKEIGYWWCQLKSYLEIENEQEFRDEIQCLVYSLEGEAQQIKESENK